MIAFRFPENCAVQHVPSERGSSGTNRGGLIRFPQPARTLGEPADQTRTSGLPRLAQAAIAVSLADRLWPRESRPRAGWRPIAAGRQVSRSMS
jgi:hypothetical protein